jgi:hypothetical protein
VSVEIEAADNFWFTRYYELLYPGTPTSLPLLERWGKATVFFLKQLNGTHFLTRVASGINFNSPGSPNFASEWSITFPPYEDCPSPRISVLLANSVVPGVFGARVAEVRYRLVYNEIREYGVDGSGSGPCVGQNYYPSAYQTPNLTKCEFASLGCGFKQAVLQNDIIFATVVCKDGELKFGSHESFETGYGNFGTRRQATYGPVGPLVFPPPLDQVQPTNEVINQSAPATVWLNRFEIKCPDLVIDYRA